MWEHTDNERRAGTGVASASLLRADGSARLEARPSEPTGGPRLRVRVIERTTLIRFEDAEFLLDDGDIRAVGEQLKGLINDDGRSRLVLNLGGVKYLSGALLGKLAKLANWVQLMGGTVQVCGLDPLLRDVLRHTRLDTVLDVCGDEAEALGLIIP